MRSSSPFVALLAVVPLLTACQNGEFQWRQALGLEESPPAEAGASDEDGTGAAAGSASSTSVSEGGAETGGSSTSASTSSTATSTGQGGAGAGGEASGATAPATVMNQKSDVQIGTEENGWTAAKDGWMARMRMQGGIETEMKVTEAEDDLLLMTTATKMNGQVVSSSGMWMARRHPKYEGQPVENAWTTTDMPDETLSIGGKSVACKVQKSEGTIDGKKVTNLTWTSKDVPGWMVRFDSDQGGKGMETLQELIAFEK